MTTSTMENQESVTVPETPQPPKKANVTARKPRVAPTKANAAHKASHAKQGRKAAHKAATAARVRPGSKTAKVLALVRQSEGANLKRLVKATGWQPHSVRGFLSGLGKKMGLKIGSRKTENGERVYSLAK